MNYFDYNIGFSKRAFNSAYYIITLICFILTQHSVSAELNVFETAAHYTVKVKARIAIPLLGSKRGEIVGAGFVVDKKRGWIISLANIASRSPSEIKIKLSKGRYIQAKKVYIDPIIDLAILAIDPTKLTKDIQSARLNCKELPASGIPVASFGYPSGGHLLAGTRGVISSVAPYRDYGVMLQSDAPTNRGVYGGPLISLQDGRVIGINTSSRSAGQNESFATPMKHVCDILALLKKGEDPSPPMLALNFYEDLDDDNILIVSHVDKSRNTMKFKKGDIILQVNGSKDKIENSSHLVHALRGHLDKAKITVKRNGQIKILTGRFKAIKNVRENYGLLMSGALYGENVFKFSNNFVRGHPKVMVHFTQTGSRSEYNQIRKFNLIVSLNNVKITSLKQFYCLLLKAKKSNTTAKMELIRFIGRSTEAFRYKLRKITLAPIKIIGDPAMVNKLEIRKKATQCAHTI